MTEEIIKPTRVITGIVPGKLDGEIQKLFANARSIDLQTADQVDPHRAILDGEEFSLFVSYHPRVVLDLSTKPLFSADKIDEAIDDAIFAYRAGEANEPFLLIEADLPTGDIRRVWVGTFYDAGVEPSSLSYIYCRTEDDMAARATHDYVNSVGLNIKLHHLRGKLAESIIDKLRFNPDSGLALAHSTDPELLHSDLVDLANCI